MPDEVQLDLYKELMLAGKAVYEAFKPWKMNYSCYGNTVEHIHWHIFPRYLTEPDHKKYPWLHSSEFEHHLINETEAKDTIALIKKRLR